MHGSSNRLGHRLINALRFDVSARLELIDVALAYRRYRAAAEAVVLYATQIIPRSEENLKSVRAAYGLGEFSIFDVINEQRRLIESETG